MIRSVNSFPKEVASSLKGFMQVGIMFSHLSYTYAEPHLLFSFSNKLGTTFIALYFFISGFGLTKKENTNKDAYIFNLKILFKRLWGILKPFVLVLFLYSLYLYFYLGKNILNNGHNFIFHGHTSLPNSWFIFTLLYLYLVHWLSVRVFKVHTLLRHALLLGLVSAHIAFCYFMGYERAWWVTTIAFVSGSFYAEFEFQCYTYLRKYWVITAMVAIVALLAYSKNDILLVTCYIFIPLVAVRLLKIIGYNKWLNSLSENGWMNKVQSTLSSISYELYLIHGCVISIIANLFPGINGCLYSASVISISVVSAWGVNKIIHRIGEDIGNMLS